MTTFLIGLVILFVGGIFYGKYCDKVFGPDDRETPAITMNDGVDFVPMNKWKNSLIELLNVWTYCIFAYSYWLCAFWFFTRLYVWYGMFT